MYNNAQQLNITTLLPYSSQKTHPLQNINSINTNLNQYNNYNDYNKNVALINTIFNNNTNTTLEQSNNYKHKQNTEHQNNNKHQNNKYKKNEYTLKKYLGEGIQGSLYVAYDTNNNKYICKKIMIDPSQNTKQLEQLNFELNLLKFLSSNKITKNYINPCVEHRIVDNQVFTVFPVFDGYSLSHLKKYFHKMAPKNYYTMLFHIIKVILYAMSKIHQNNIAHQNINENSILVSTHKKVDDIKVKFTDFGLGCGINNENSYINSMLTTINKCKSTTPPSHLTPTSLITTSLLNQISPTNNYLSLEQKHDITGLGYIFIQLLLLFENIKLDLSKGYTNELKKEIKHLITSKFVSLLKLDSVLKKDILEYLSILNNYILCEEKNMKDCQYILDKLIIYEKYKNDTF
jgi:hypothetical protein